MPENLAGAPYLVPRQKVILPSVDTSNFQGQTLQTREPQTIDNFILRQSAIDAKKSKGVSAEGPMLSDVADQLTGRYDSIVYGANNEDVYAQQQSGLAQAVNGTLKGLNIAGTTIAGGFGMVGGIVGSLFTQKLSTIWDNPVMNNLDKWNNYVDQQLLPNYESDREKEAAWYNTDNFATTNFVFNKLVKNAGFAVGAMVSGNMVNGLLKAGGAAIGASLDARAAAAAASQTFKTFSPLLKNMSRAFSVAKNIEANALLEAGISNIGDVDALSAELANIASTTNKLANIGDKGRRAVIASYSSFGEADFEAGQTAKEYRETLIQQYKDSHFGIEPSGDDLKAINESASNVGATSLIGNVALLGVTEYAQLNKLLGSSYSAEKQAANSMMGKVSETVKIGGKYIPKASTTKFGKIVEGALKVGKFVFDPKEALQENLQYALQIGTQNYFNKAYQGKEAQNLIDSALYGLYGVDKYGKAVGSFNSKEGIEGTILGGITGGLMQGIGNWNEATKKSINTAAHLQELNAAPTFRAAFVDRMGSVNRGVKLQEEEQDAVVAGDILEAKDRKADQMHNYLSTRIKYGRFDMVMQDIQDLHRISSTKEGLSQLKEEGTANINDDIPSFQKRLNTFEKVAKDTNEIYKALDLRYSGMVNNKGEVVYSPEIIDKLAYAASKISNYDRRIPEVNVKLDLAGVYTGDMFEKIMDGSFSTAEAKKQAYAFIDKRNIAPEEKTTLKLALDDIVEMALRRKLYMNEYEDIKKNPNKWKTGNQGISAQEVTDSKGEVIPPPAAAQPVATPVTSTEPTTVEPVIETPIVVTPIAKYTNTNGKLEDLEVGREYTNNNPSNPLQKFKVAKINDDGTVEIELPDGSTATYDPAVFVGYDKVRTGKDAIVDIANEIKEIQEELEEKSDFSTGFEVDQYNDEKEGALPSADKLFFRTKTVSSRDPRYTAGLPINVTNYNEFVNNVDSFPNRKNFRFTYVTPNRQNALGLSRLAEFSYMKEDSFVTTDVWLESISKIDDGVVMAVFTEFDNGKLFLIDKDGKRIKNQDGSDAVLGNPNNNFDIKQTIFSTTPTINEKARSSDDSAVVEQYRTLWKDQRKILFTTQYQAGDPIDSYEFGLSKGFAVKEKGKVQHNAISKVFNKIKQSVISGVQGLIEVSTLGYITHKDGIAYKFAVGRPVLKYGDKLEYLQNDKITANQAVSIVKVLEKLYNVLVDSSMPKDQKIKENTKLLTYIKSVLFWSSKKVTNNSFFINYATGDINIAGQNFDFSNIQGQEKEIIEKLSNVYTNTSNELLTKYFNEPFYEQFWDGKTLQERKWTNYQTYLLSDVMPDNKTKRTTAPPLTVNVTIPTTSVPYAYEQKYAFPTNFKLAVPQAPVTEAVVDPVPQSTGYKTDGTLNKIMFNGVQFTFTHNGKEATLDLSPEFLNGKELIEGVKRIADANPTINPELIRSTFINAALVNINNTMAEQIAAQAPVVTIPETETLAVNKVGKLYDLDEELNNYQLANEFKFITPLLKANNIQVSYDAAHLGGNLPKVASIDTEVVDGKYKIILTINKSTFDTKSAAEQKYIIAHEFVHGLIKVKLNEKGDIKGTELYKGLIDIHQSVQDYFHKAASGINKEAAEVLTKNFSKPKITRLREMLDHIVKFPEEMATIGLTDPDMIKFLKLMPGTAPAYTKKSLFAQLSDMISKFLGLSNSKFNDLLTFMSEQLEQAVNNPDAVLDLSDSAQSYLNQQPAAKKPRRGRDNYPVFEELSAEEKYYAVQDFTAKFYLTLYNNNVSLFNVDKNVANQIFKGIVESYKKSGSQITDDQYMEIIDTTKRQLASLYISFNADELVTINDESASDRLYAPEAFSVNLKKSTPFAVKILTSSLVRTDGKQSEDPRFLPKAKLSGKHGRVENTIELIPESEVYSALVNKLVNIKNVQDFVDKLYKIAQSNADYVQLFVRLGGSMTTGQVDFDAMDDADFRLFVSAMQTFTKAKPEMFIQYLKEDSTFRGAADLTNGAKQVEKRWINNMIVSSKIESSVIKYNAGKKQFEANIGDPDISTPEKMIDFLNKLGITFTMPIYNKLNESQVEKFTKAVIKIKTDLTSAKTKGIVTLKKGRFKTLGNGITRLADLFTAVEMPNQNNSLYNAEGKRINSLTESNAPSLFEYQFNSIMNVSEIAEKMPQLKDVFSQSSQILQAGGPLFNEDGDRRLDEFGNPIELKVQVISGEIDQDENEGSGVSGMSQSDRYITEINQNINGSYYILVPADSSTEWMMNLGNRISYKQFAAGRGYQDAFEMMLLHLDADIELALDVKNRELLKNVGDKGRDLRFFKDILSDNLLNKFNSLIEDRVAEKIEEKEFRTELAKLQSENFDIIKKDIIDYLTEGRDKMIKTLEDLKLVTVVSDKNNEALYKFKKLDSNFQDEVKEVSGIDTNNMSKEELNIVVEFLSTNYQLNNIEFHKILFGDPYQFAIKNKNGKTILEETKRIKMFLSPRKFSIDFPQLNAWLNESNNTIYTETEDIILDENDFGYHESKSYINTAIVKDVIVEADLYPGVKTNEADAFSLMSPGFYKEVKTKNAQWPDEANAFHNWQMAYARKQLAAKGVYKGYETKPALKKYDEELTSKPSPKFTTDVIKPVVSGDKFGKTSIDLVGHKMSQMPIYYQAVEGKVLEDIFIKMFNEKRDYIVMESGGKVGTLEERHQLYKDGKINDEPFNNLIQVPFKAYGIQVETGYREKNGTTLGSQPTKIATIDLFSGGQAIGDTPERQQIIKDAVERHDNALKALYTEAADSLLTDLGITLEDDKFVLHDKRKLSNLLKQEILTDDASDNLIASLEINEETGDFVLPLESSANYMQIVRLLYSLIHKRIVSPKVNGMSAVQVPVTGWEDLSKGRRVVEINGKKVLTDDTLKFYEDKDGERYCEIYTTLPPQARALFTDKNKFPDNDAIVDYLNKQAPEALMGIGFRIPNQALNSNERFKIAGLLPDFMGNTVVVPSAITTKAGSDFDIDKLNMYIKSLFKDALGNIRVVELKGSEEETKAFYSEIFDQMSENEQRFITKQIQIADASQDNEAQEKLVGKQEKLNDRIANKEKFINKTYRQALENEYYSAIDTLLALPENFKQLTTPNTTATLMGIADEMDVLTGYDENAIKNRILDRTYMSFLRHAFITGKRWIGISATATTGHSNAQKAGTFVDHIFKMSLPHNKTADGKVDLSQRFFKDTKKYISEILSQFTSAFADVGNDPFILKLIYSNQVVSSFMFLARAGVDPRQAAMFMNQPIVKDFVTTADADNKYILTEMTYQDPKTKQPSILVQEIMNKYATSEAARERTAEIDVNNLDKNIGVKLTEDQKAEQLLILQEFFSIAKAANGLFIITEATNYDTAKFSNADDFRRKQMKTLTQYKFAEDSFRISSAKDLLDKTHLRTLVNALTKANRGLGAILRFNMPSYRAIINQVIDTYAINDYVSPTNFSRIANKLSASLLDYIIQTNISFDVANLVYGEDSVINKFQNAVKSYPDIKILQDLEVIPGKTIVAPSTIALKVSPETSADSNRYTEGFRELRDNAETNDLYKGLVKLAILQGTYKTSASFREVVPIEDISTEITKAVNAPGVVERLKDYYKNARFQRTNFNDAMVAPRVNPPIATLPQANIETQWGDEIEAYTFTSAISFTRQGAESARDLIGLDLKSKGAAYDFVTISRAIPTKSGDMVDFETGYTIQGSDYAAEMQKDESAYSKIYGYQKVKYDDGTPVKMKMDANSPIQFVYKLVNLYGDGRFLTEYQNTLQKSELNNGTIKVDKEYSDDSIIKALRQQSKLAGFTQAPVAPAVQPTAVEMQKKNVEKLLNGTKTTTIRASVEKGGNINVGETRVVDFGGKDFNVTNRGYLTIEEAGGKEAMLKSEGVTNESELMYNQSRDWMNGKGKMYVYDISPVSKPAAVVETKPANIEVIEKLEMAKNKLEAFEFTADGIFYNYFRSGARIKPGSFDRLVDRNKRSASTNGAYTSTKGAYSYDTLARQAYEASNMEVDDVFAVESLEEFLSSYPDTWKTPYNNIVNEIKDLENQLKSIEKVVSSQPTIGNKMITPSGKITLKDGNSYNTSDINSEMLEAMGYKAREIGTIVKSICI